MSLRSSMFNTPFHLTLMGASSSEDLPPPSGVQVLLFHLGSTMLHSISAIISPNLLMCSLPLFFNFLRSPASLVFLRCVTCLSLALFAFLRRAACHSLALLASLLAMSCLSLPCLSRLLVSHLDGRSAPGLAHSRPFQRQKWFGCNTVVVSSGASPLASSPPVLHFAFLHITRRLSLLPPCVLLNLVAHPAAAGSPCSSVASVAFQFVVIPGDIPVDMPFDTHAFQVDVEVTSGHTCPVFSASFLSRRRHCFFIVGICLLVCKSRLHCWQHVSHPLQQLFSLHHLQRCRHFSSSPVSSPSLPLRTSSPFFSSFLLSSPLSQ